MQAVPLENPIESDCCPVGRVLLESNCCARCFHSAR